MPLPGAPIGPDIPTSSHRLTFDHVPELWELMPNEGWPGVTYAQVCVHNVKHARDREERPANLRPIQDAFYYSITGPRGEAQMALVGCGKPIPGAAPESGARLFFTDGEVTRITGHAVKYPIWFREQPEEKPSGEVKVEEDAGQQGGGQPGSPQRKDRQGDARGLRPQP